MSKWAPEAAREEGWAGGAQRVSSAGKPSCMRSNSEQMSLYIFQFIYKPREWVIPGETVMCSMDLVIVPFTQVHCCNECASLERLW